jgi:hypothetical protein
MNQDNHKTGHWDLGLTPKTDHGSPILQGMVPLTLRKIAAGMSQCTLRYQL